MIPRKTITLIIILATTPLLLHHTGWNMTTIISDTTPPSINTETTTHGKIAYPSMGKPTLITHIQENIKLETVTATIKTTGGLLGIGSKTIETLTLNQVTQNDNHYKHRATLTQSLTENTEYKILYKATDHAGNQDTYTTTLTLVQLAGNIKVNGIKITDPDQTIILNTHTLFIQVEITQGQTSIHHIQLLVNGEKTPLTHSQGKYITTIQLRKDGEYNILVQALDKTGQDTQLASFNIDLKTTRNPKTILGAALTLLAFSALAINQQRGQKR